MKDHEVRELVNALTGTAKAYHGTQQLRDRISAIVQDALHVARHNGAPEDTPLPCDVTVGHTTFHKGVALSTFITAARRWHRVGFPGTASGETSMTLDRDTPMLPLVMADRVVSRWIWWLDSVGRPSLARQVAGKEGEVAAYLADKAEWHYQHALLFRTKMQSRRGNQARDTLYAFMYHWMTAAMQRSFPELRGSVPSEVNGTRGTV